MKWLKKYKYLLFLLGFFGLTACQESPEERYIELEEKELASGLRYDSLFRGIYFNMSREAFKDYCFNQNLEGKFKQGGLRSGNWVECKLKDELKYPAAINFFPKFKNDVITEMEAAIYYENIAVDDQRGELLLSDVLQLLERWYGEGFMKINSPYFYKDDVYVKVDGNRRITVYKDISKHMINIWYVDLTVKNKEGES
ncbi:hypothetical protein WJR50_15680 [Catalinimonas sp. 4WD22]|uniref:hypothetical protein n=1 Tax=Catalinimonas locisalis TaxID=3133978 RepID=UPI0031010EDD